MLLLHEILDFFALETLDTRLVPATAKKQAVIQKSCPVSKWNTLEFKIYGVIFAVVVPFMFKAAMDSLNETNPNYPRFKHLLSDGWIFGRQVDNLDLQYSFFRDNALLIIAIVTGHQVLRRALLFFQLFQKRTSFDFIYGIGFVFAMHGFNIVKIALHVTIMYSIGKFAPDYRVALWGTWIYGISSLFINEKFWNTPWGINIIDTGFHGIIARWDVFYNVALLRMMSFNLDFIEKKFSDPVIGRHEKIDSLDVLDDRERLEAPLPISDYSIIHYIAYLTYAPLFIVGPIITFNDYLYQANYVVLPSVQDAKRIAMYFLRLVFCALTMEFLLHYMYVVAVSKTHAWDGDSPFQISMFGLFSLNIIWLKLLIPWRLFRFWALLDGIDPPENMIRCMDNNYSALAFWRAWHRSYNRWVIRYLYVPLGGAGGKNSGATRRVVNSLVVFSFVAIWHDIELKLLLWGWLVVLFLVPEILATIYFKKHASSWWFRYVCGIGAVVNIWMMMLANLFGFSLGKDGMALLLGEMFHTWSGFEFFVLASTALFVGGQVMFELREAEKRRGVDVRC